jgi:hypothetical protein
MPLTLNVGLSKKIGLPDYGSLGASCNVQVELPTNTIFDDLDAFHRQVRQAYKACTEAVTDELARNQQNGTATSYANPPSATNGNGAHKGNGHANPSTNRINGRRATASQIRAMRAIADWRQLDLARELHLRFGMDRPDDLSIAEASQCIDELKTSANGQSVGRG